MDISGATRSELIARLRKAEKLLEENCVGYDDIYTPEYSCLYEELAEQDCD